jgi:hypothetical protein
MKRKYDCNAVLEYSEQLFDTKNSGFRFFRSGNSTILSTSFGVQLNFLLGNLANYPTDKISTALKEQQDAKTGLFIDSHFDMKDVVGFEEEYILWQFSYFATIALDMLSEAPVYPFNFLISLKDKEALEKWLNKQDFKKFWRTSNKLMFLLYFLTYEQERLGTNNSKLTDLLFSFLDAKQDAKTGFWGIQSGATLENGMFGAAHIYLYYDFYNREINYKERIINNVIRLQNTYGLFGSNFGGACEDYDAVEILSVLIKHCDYKRDFVKTSVGKTYEMILKHQNRDGGFPYSIDTRSFRRKLKDTVKKRPYVYKYSGWQKMKSSLFESDLWGTYFRVLTIVKIERMLGIISRNKYNFYSLPGWGY